VKWYVVLLLFAFYTSFVRSETMPEEDSIELEMPHEELPMGYEFPEEHKEEEVDEPEFPQKEVTTNEPTAPAVHDAQQTQHQEQTNRPANTQTSQEQQNVPITPPMAPPVVSNPGQETEAELNIEDMPIPDTQIASIDTMALENPQGNWLLKKMWWERAEERYEKLKNFTDDISDKRVDFFKQRSVLDKDLFDTFYLELGMEFSEFSTTINDLVDRLEQEQVSQEDLKEKQQNLIDSIRLEKATIEQVKANIDDLKKVDNAIENALGIVIETVNNARQYDREGWNCFKEISRLLDDKKARELFYRLDVALQNIKQLNNYLSQDFASYFSHLETRAHTIVATLNNQLAELKEKGIDLRNKVTLFEQEERKELVKEEVETEEEEVRQPKSWWRRTIDTAKSLFGF